MKPLASYQAAVHYLLTRRDLYRQLLSFSTATRTMCPLASSTLIPIPAQVTFGILVLRRLGDTEVERRVVCISEKSVILVRSRAEIEAVRLVEACVGEVYAECEGE